MNKIVFLRNLSQKHVQTLKELAPHWEVIYSKESSVYLEHLKDAEIIVGWKDNAEESLDINPKLKWIHSWSAGVDTMPLEKLKQQNITLTNTSGTHAFPISETVFAMILSFTRRVNTYIRNQLQSKWIFEDRLEEIHGKTIGIIGVGAIGEETARIAKAFNMKVLGVRRSGSPLPFVDEMFDMKGLDEVIRRSDYIVNILPSTKETYKVIGKDQFNQMKTTGFYVNVGRGETTDTEALIEALENNLIAGAGLDVFDTEPLQKDNPLWSFENVIITPHNAGATEYYDERAFEIFIANFKDYLNGKVPSINLIDLDKQY